MIVETIEIDADNRIVVEHDIDAGNPRVDWDSEVGHMFYTYGEGDYISPDGKETDYEYAFRYFYEQHRMGQTWRWTPNVFERWLRINFGTAYVETMPIDRASEALIYVTQEDLEAYGWRGEYGYCTEEEIRGYLRGALETYRAWANGEVYVVSHQRRENYVRVTDLPNDEGWEIDMNDALTQWVQVDSIGGVYLTDEYTVHDVATEHFDVN